MDRDAIAARRTRLALQRGPERTASMAGGGSELEAPHAGLPSGPPGAEIAESRPGEARPRFWPAGVHWVTRNVDGDPAASRVGRAFRSLEVRIPLPGLEVRLLPPNHPVWAANMDTRGQQRGVFATDAFPDGAWLADYVGAVRELTSVDHLSPFVMESPAGIGEFEKMKAGLPFKKVAIDANVYGNEMRFVNDFRNVAAASNVVFKPYLRYGYGRPWDEAGEVSAAVAARRTLGSAELAIGCFSVQNIASGDELLAYYGDHYPLPVAPALESTRGGRGRGSRARS